MKKVDITLFSITRIKNPLGTFENIDNTSTLLKVDNKNKTTIKDSSSHDNIEKMTNQRSNKKSFESYNYGSDNLIIDQESDIISIIGGLRCIIYKCLNLEIDELSNPDKV